MTVHDLPAVNATLNGLSALFLTAGYVCIKLGKQRAHQICMVSAFGTSILFLGCYLSYHALTQTVTRFVHPLEWRPVYLFILISHTVLAGVIVPAILMTLWQARQKSFGRHKNIARWTLPLWLYVSVTGVVIYLMLYQIFPQR